MKKHIAEDLPARKFPQASLSKGGNDRDRQDGDKGGNHAESKTPEKKVRQAVYDIKYRARRENIPLRSAYTQYMQNSSMSEQEKSMVREKLFGKGGIMKEMYLNDVSELASNSVSKALYTVFVEKKSEVIEYDQLKGELEEAAHINALNKGDRKYKVRVTDKNGTSYVRYANREKINSLRANPNIDSVEMTEYGEPYEGERSGGKQTAAAKAGKDYDSDGKVESGAKEHAGAVHNAIQRKKGGVPDGKDTSSVKEEFLGEVKKNKTSEKKYDVMRGTNKSIIKLSPSDGMHENAYSKFLNVLNEKKLTSAEKSKKEEIVNKLKPKYGKTSKTYAIATSVAKRVAEESECGYDGEKKEKIKGNEKGTDDPRSIPTKVSLFKNKLRAMGLKMDYEPEGEQIDELNRYEKETGKDSRTDKPTSSGGKYGGSDTTSRAMRSVLKSMGSGRMGVEPRGKKKEPGKKPPKAGEYGGPASPAQKVAKRRAERQRSQDNMSSRFD